MSAGPDEPRPAPRADFVDAIGWIALGVAVLVGSWTMDRLENQDVPPFAAPGLLPGLLGIVLVVMGGLLMVRSVRSAGFRSGRVAAEGLLGPAPGRALGVIGLCMLFGGGLVGHGLPFWAAAALFVTVAIPFLRRGVQPLGLRTVGSAAVVGLGAGVGITLLFQQLFLVRLP